MGSSNLTEKRIKNAKQSAISDLLLQCDSPITFDNFQEKSGKCREVSPRLVKELPFSFLRKAIQMLIIFFNTPIISRLELMQLEPALRLMQRTYLIFLFIMFLK